MAKKKDPRTQGKLRTANETLQDRAIRHAIYLERYKTRAVQTIIKFVNRDMIPSLVRELERRLPNIATTGVETTISSTSRLRGLVKASDAIVEQGIKVIKDRTTLSLTDLAIAEAKTQLKMFADAIPVDISFTIPNVGYLKSIVTSRPMQGKVLKDWYAGLERGVKDTYRKEIQKGLALGEAVPDMVKRVRGGLGSTTSLDAKINREVEAIVRTAANHVSTNARDATYAENSDVVKGYKIVATLDSRTTPICRQQDGKVYPISEKSPRPPFHFNCRTTTTPVMKSWKELGIDLQEAPEGTRASMNGQVPESVTYNEWLKTQDAATQDEVLGKTRGKLLREGKVEVDKFTDNKGKLLTLKQLAQKEGLTLE